MGVHYNTFVFAALLLVAVIQNLNAAPDTKPPPTGNKPLVKQTPPTGDKPSVKKTPLTGDKPSVKQTPATGDKPTVKETPPTGDKPAVKETPPTDDKPSVKQTPPTGDKPPAKEMTPEKQPSDKTTISDKKSPGTVPIKDKSSTPVRKTTQTGPAGPSTDKATTGSKAQPSELSETWKDKLVSTTDKATKPDVSTQGKVKTATQQGSQPGQRNGKSSTVTSPGKTSPPAGPLQQTAGQTEPTTGKKKTQPKATEAVTQSQPVAPKPTQKPPSGKTDVKTPSQQRRPKKPTRRPRPRQRAKPFRQPPSTKSTGSEQTKPAAVPQQPGQTNAPKTQTLAKPPPINLKKTRGDRRKTEAEEKRLIETATTVDGLPCSERFRPDPFNQMGYQERTPDNFWILADCAADLVWKQEMCRCDYEDQNIQNKPCSDFRKHPTERGKYERLVNGVWEEEICNIFTDDLVWYQERCICDWDIKNKTEDQAPMNRRVRKLNLDLQCLNLLHMPFDTDLKDYASNFWIDKRYNANIRHSHVPGDVNGSVEIRNSPLKIEGFSGNDLTGVLRVMFRFKVHPSRTNNGSYMVLISNGCRSWSGALHKPSLALSFIPVNETFRVQFNTTTKKIERTVHGTADAFGWYKVVLFLQDQVVQLVVNEESLLKENGMSGSIVKSNCPLMIAGAPLKLDYDFDGYFDDLVIMKQCKYNPKPTDGTAT